MSIENLKIKLAPITLSPLPEGGRLLVQQTSKSYKLSKLQYSYLEVLQNPMSLTELFDFYLKQGWLISFRELYSLLQFMSSEKLLLNPEFTQYFAQVENDTLSKTINTKPFDIKKLNPKELPFFRSLKTDQAEFLLKEAKLCTYSAGQSIIKAGATDRDLFIILTGAAGIYKKEAANKQQLLAIISDYSIFGEAGYFLGKTRSADIVARTDCQILKVPHSPKIDQYVQQDKASSLQHHFWILQALHSSPFFSEFPGHTLDQIVFSGRLLKTGPHQVLIKQGQSAQHCYILIQGSAIVSKDDKNINVLNSGSCFGEIALLSGTPRTASITTQKESLVLEIHRDVFYKIMAQNIFLAKNLEELALSRLSKDKLRAA